MTASLARGALLLFVLTSMVSPASASVRPSTQVCEPSLAAAIPERAFDAVDASAFVAEARDLSGEAREQRILKELTAGNVPDFLRQLHPVTFRGDSGSGAGTAVTLCVTPDYLAVGSDEDFLRVPMGLDTALVIAQRFGFGLPTTKIVDAIYAQAEGRLAPRPMKPGPQMTSTDYYSRHNRTVEQQRNAEGVSLGALLAGHKKDLVLSNRLRSKPGRVAIYGWHRPGGKPIQPLSTVHGAEYADYSHGVRLVSAVAYVDGEERPLFDVLEDPKLASLISREGRIPDAEKLALTNSKASLQVAAAKPAKRDG
ncbi:MAG: hypothetical protein ABFS23_06560 [Pseudomonadota bacterium]